MATSLHMTTTHPHRTTKGRQVFDVSCRCSWRVGSYISLASARAAGDRHLAETNGAQG